MRPGEQGGAYPLSAPCFHEIRRLVHDAAGIALGPNKEALVTARLSRRVRALGLPSFDAYVEHVRAHPEERTNLVNAITTNKTSFFREPAHFELLTRALPELCRARAATRRLRVWSAAASTGEEPWSIAMTLHAYFADKAGWDWRVLATDIDTEVLRAAEAGVYEATQVEPTPETYRTRYFDRRGTTCTVREALRAHVGFRRLDLVHDAFRFREPVDVIFCRNVMIYFDAAGREAVLAKFHACLADDGYLIVGHSESLLGEAERFRFVQSSAYRRVLP